MEYKVGSLADMISSSLSTKKTKLSKQKKVKMGMKVKFEKVQTPTQGMPSIQKGNEKKRKLDAEMKSPMEKRLRFSEPLEVDLGKQFKKKRKIKNIEAKESIDLKDSSENTEHIADKVSRTIFVGNVPKTTTKKALKSLFLKYGLIETIRIRSVAVADPRISQKVAAIRGELHPKRTNVNAYIRFKDDKSAHMALVNNGTVINEHTLRVDLAMPGDKFDTKKSIFIGNLNFEIEEEALRSMFNSCGKIISIRLIRDNKTGLSKGFGYVNFENADAVELALKLNGEMLANRPLRVARSDGGSKVKRKKSKDQKLNASFGKAVPKKKKKAAANESNKNKSPISEFQGEKTGKKKLKKKKMQSKGELKKKIMQSKLEVNPKSKKKKFKFLPSTQN